MVDIVRLRHGEVISPASEYLIVRRNQAGNYGLFGVLDGDPVEFAISRDSYLSEARAVDAARSFAVSMHVDRIIVFRGS